MARPKSDDPASQMAIYPARSLRERAERQADRKGEKPATYIVEALRQRVEADEKEEAGF